MSPRSGTAGPDLWGGVECTVNRVHDRRFNQLERSGHAQRLEDLERFASLGLKAIRYPALWECHAPDGPHRADWSWLDERLPALQALQLRPIVGLVHHGSGPMHTNLLDDAFATGLQAYARAFARRYPWVEDYTPVNEPLTTARFSALYGTWYPHERSDAAFARALLNQCRATILAMQAVREINPRARLVQTEDLGTTYSTPALADIAEFYNQRRWLSWDLLCGRIDPDHPLYGYLRRAGIPERELDWFVDNRCPPDVIGINHYVTGDRWLDERVERYPAYCRGGAGGRAFADIEVSRAVVEPVAGVGPLLQQAWSRYGIPLAITEVHIDANREDQMRWFFEAWQAACQARRAGAQVEAVTIWALLGTFDWNSLVTRDNGYYEPGTFDVRASPPRETAMASLLRGLANGSDQVHPVLSQGRGWWRRPNGRYLCQPPVASVSETPAAIAAPATITRRRGARPLLVVGAGGTLGKAFHRLCLQRELACVAVRRQDLDLLDGAALGSAIESLKPWAVVNAGGWMRVDEAERDPQRCRRLHVEGPAELARACQAAGSQLLCFSSDLVFDGRSKRPYLESDEAVPLNVLGRSKMLAEQAVLSECHSAMVVRSSAFFGPWDRVNFLVRALNALARGTPIHACAQTIVSPTYVPDLVHACLDLLIDRETGLWHLSNGKALTWADWLLQGVRRQGRLDRSLVLRSEPLTADPPQRPRYRALGTERGCVLPSLDSAMDRFFDSLASGRAGADLAPVAVR